MKKTQRREFTMSKHDTAVNWTDSSGSSSKANITPNSLRLELYTEEYQ